MTDQDIQLAFLRLECWKSSEATANYLGNKKFLELASTIEQHAERLYLWSLNQQKE